VYDLDPEKLTIQGDNVIWSFADLPDDPINTPDWSDRNIGACNDYVSVLVRAATIWSCNCRSTSTAAPSTELVRSVIGAYLR